MRDVRRGFVVQDTDYREAIPRAAEWGLDFVEIPMEGCHDRHGIRDQANSIGALAKTEGVDVLVHLPFRVDLASPYERVREATHRELEDCIEAADCVSARKAVLHPRTDALRAVYDDETLRGQLVDRILDLDSYADHAGIELCVENLPGDFFTLADHFPDLMDRGVSVTFDTGHAHVDGLDAADQAAFLREYGEAVSHVHLNDTRGDDENEHLPPGAGAVDLETALAPLRDGWTGTVSVDVRIADWEYLGASVRRLDRLLGIERGDRDRPSPDVSTF